MFLAILITSAKTRKHLDAMEQEKRIMKCQYLIIIKNLCLLMFKYIKYTY